MLKKSFRISVFLIIILGFIGNLFSFAYYDNLSTLTKEDRVLLSEKAENANLKKYEKNKLIVVDGGDLSGERQANVKVDIGFGKRKYYAYTNQYGQLVMVKAKKIVLQDEQNEKVTSKGRYYRDEAKVPGTESKYLDEGHVIADSLGGVSNAYNITPQNYILNRHGDQAYMEKVIRDAGGATDFLAIITYPNTKTQIPSHYSYTYTINGNVIHDEFDNVNPDKVNKDKDKDKEDDNGDASNSADKKVKIVDLDKKREYIVIKNFDNKSVNLKGYEIVSVRGNQRFRFTNFILKSGASVVVGDSGRNVVDFHWLQGKGIWANSKRDDAELYNADGKLISSYVGK